MRKPLLLAYLLFAISANAQYTFSSFNLNPSGNSDPDNFVVGNKLVFVANDGSKGREPYVTALTSLAPTLASDINSSGDCNCSKLVYNNQAVYLKATDNGTTGDELYKIDLSSGSNTTTLLMDINPGSTGSSISKLCVSNGKVFFSAQAPSLLDELWVTDGTSTNNVQDVCTPSCSSTPREMTSFNNAVYFAARYNIGEGIELCSSTGTSVTYVNDIRAGANSSNPRNFRAVGTSKLFFLTEQSFYSRLTVYDGTTVTLLKDLNPVNPNSYGVENLTEWGELNGKVYFKANDGVNGEELWVSDGTDVGTVRVKDINPGAGDSNPGSFCTYMGKLYFSADDGTNGRELWETDGTDAGTKLYKDINPTGSSDPSLLVENRDRVYFKAMQTTGDYQLFEFQSSGPSSYVKMIAPAGATKTNPLGNTNQIAASFTNRTVYFSANYDNIGQEVWALSNPTNVSVAKSEATRDFSVFPNPNNGTFTLQLANADFKNGSITVYNILGASVYQSPITDHKSQIIHLNQPAGTYLVKLQLDDALLTKRLVVE